MREVFETSQVNVTYIGYQGERWRLYPLQLHCCIKRAGYQKGFKGFVHFFRSIHLAVQVYAPPALLAGERVRERPRPRGNPLGPLHLFFFLDELKNWLANVWKWKTRTKRYPAWSAPSDFFLDELKLWLWKSMNVKPYQWVWNSTGATSKSHWFSLSHLDESKEYQTRKNSTTHEQKRRHHMTFPHLY